MSKRSENEWWKGKLRGKKSIIKKCTFYSDIKSFTRYTSHPWWYTLLLPLLCEQKNTEKGNFYDSADIIMYNTCSFISVHFFWYENHVRGEHMLDWKTNIFYFNVPLISQTSRNVIAMYIRNPALNLGNEMRFTMLLLW